MMMVKAFLFALVVYEANAKAGMIIGGFGASDSIEVVTATGVCQSSEAKPVLPRAPIGRFGWTAQYVEDQIVLCGGADVEFYDVCYALTIGNNAWSQPFSMGYRRRYPESLVFNGQMVVMGGYNQNQGWLKSVERKKTGGEFEEITGWALPRGIFDFCAVQMDEERIMVLGGNELGLFETNNVDILNTKTNTWTSGTPMEKERATHDCVVAEYGGQKGVMVSGGCSANCRYHLTDVSFLSFTTNTWTELPSLNIGRMGHKMLLIDGKPTVIGGFLDRELTEIEMFDGTSWTIRDEKLKFARFHYGAPDHIPVDITC